MKIHSCAAWKQSIFLVNIHTLTFLFLSLTSCIAAIAESRPVSMLCGTNPFCSNKKPLELLMILWKSCSMLKCMSSLHDCYWPSEIFISGLQIVECPTLVPISSCLPLLLLTIFSIPRPQENLIEVEPISPYTVFTQTQSCAVLLSPSPSWLELSKHSETSAHKHSHTYTNTHTIAIHTTVLIYGGSLFHTGGQITSHRKDTFKSSLLHTCKGGAPFHQRPPFQSTHMSSPPVPCV